jgi:Tol biopolymer transport system component/DNA-binding winged helix-turn-helix (wHTH) protein
VAVVPQTVDSRPTVLHFGEFELDFCRQELRRQGVSLALQEKPLQLLLALLEDPGHVVTREDLYKRLWPDHTFVGFEDGLNTAIRKLRHCLGDSAETPQLIETVPKRGYRFIAKVDFVLPIEDSANISSGPSKRKILRNLVIATGATLAVAAMVFVATVQVNRKNTPFQKTEVSRLTTSGKVTIAAISPDGKYVAYATAESAALIEEPFVGKETLWVRQVVTGSDVEIVPPTDVHYGGLTFSRDGDFLYVTQSESKERSLGVLYKMPVLGGTKKKLVVDIAIEWWYSANPVTLSPDGKRVAFLRDSKAMKETVLIAANEDGSGEKQLAICKWPDGFTGMVAWSPNGNTIATAVRKTEAGVEYTSLFEVPVQGGALRSLTQKHWPWIADLTWVPDGRGLVANTQERSEGPVQLVYVSYANGEVRRITSDPNYYHTVSVTADSRVVATTQFEFSLNAWVAPMTALDSAKPITSDGRGDEPTWSPDGRIVHYSYDDGNIWLIEFDGSNPKQLTSKTGGDNVSPRFSPDGHYIVFGSDRTGSWQIWRMDSDGNNSKQLTDNLFDGSGADFSPDGEWVVYTKTGATKGIWKVSIEGGNPVRLNDAEARNPTVSPDGKTIAYSYGEPSANPPDPLANALLGIAIIPFKGGPPTKRFDIPHLTSFRWAAADGRSLLFTRNEGGVDNFWRQPIAGGAPRQISHFKNEEIDSFDLSRDGKWLVMSRGTTRQDVVLIHDLR